MCVLVFLSSTTRNSAEALWFWVWFWVWFWAQVRRHPLVGSLCSLKGIKAPMFGQTGLRIISRFFFQLLLKRFRTFPLRTEQVLVRWSPLVPWPSDL